MLEKKIFEYYVLRSCDLGLCSCNLGLSSCLFMFFNMNKQSRLLQREVGEVDFKLRGLVFFFLIYFFLIFGFVFLLFLFKTHLNLNSCDFWFLIFLFRLN